MPDLVSELWLLNLLFATGNAMQHYYTAIVTSTGIICTTVVCPSKDVLKGGCNRERVKQGVKHLFARRSADQQREHIVRFP